MAADASSGAPARECAGCASGLTCRARNATKASEETVSTLDDQRRYLAEELETVCGLRTSALIDAFATVPREDFLPRGPWLIRSESDYFAGPPRHTPDDNARWVCHNVAVAIDPARQLFNGAPSVLALCIDRLELGPGQRVLHIGCGLGYYSAL